MMPTFQTSLIILTIVTHTAVALADDAIIELRRYDAPEAVQAVAVDDDHFYAIANSRIGKYDRETGKLKTSWQASDDYPLTHLNSGIVRDGRLYCAHSNYPKVPNTSSVEIWDTRTLQHVGSHSFGIYEGSLTWIDWKDDAWWAVFAHYSGRKRDDPQERGHEWTSLVRFDAKWRRLEGWGFPPQVLARFAPNSCSGGAWGPDGSLYCTGHDHKEVYRLRLPKAGSTLILTNTLPAPFTGQGIAWHHKRTEIWGIDRPKRQVIKGRLQ